MKRGSEILSLALGLSSAMAMLSSCGGDDHFYQHTAYRTPPTSSETNSRINVVRIYSTGALQEYFTSIDLGIQKVVSSAQETHECRILDPISEELRARSSSPTHLYMNKTQEEFDEKKGNTDVERFFFEEDDLNRNGREDSFEMTQKPSQEYLKFLNKWKISNSEWEFYVGMDLGGYKFTGNVRARTWVNGEDCESGAFLCTSLTPEGRCTTDDWPNRIESIIVHISPWRYPWGKYVQNVEATPYGGGTPFKIGG